ncbi:MAG: hypothetical protein WCA98_19750, partial [Candidatus Acidiferrales bacterium]
MTAGLMVNHEASAQQRPQNLPWLDDRDIRAHLGAQWDAKFLRARNPLVGYFLAGFPQAVNVAT